MKDVICIEITKNHIYDCSTSRIGRKGENLSTCLEITLDNELVGLDVYIEFLKPNGESLVTPKIELINNVATYDIPLYLLDTEGALTVQIVLREISTDIVWKSYTKTYAIEDGICACDDIPEKEDFITEAQKLLDEIKETGGSSISELENVLRDILEAIQNGGTTSTTIAEIEQIIVSYFENKTVEEVEA